jgi:hypothetical protein
VFSVRSSRQIHDFVIYYYPVSEDGWFPDVWQLHAFSIVQSQWGASVFSSCPDVWDLCTAHPEFNSTGTKY